MKFNYDRVADAIYLNLNRGKIKKTVEMNNGVVVDMGEKGKIIGIEILNFSHQQKNINKLADFVKGGIPLQITDATPLVA